MRTNCPNTGTKHKAGRRQLAVSVTTDITRTSHTITITGISSLDLLTALV